MNHLFCCGFGFTARTLVARLHPHHWRVSATYRDPSDFGAGVAALHFGDFPTSPVTHLLMSVPPDREGDPVLRCYGDWLSTQPDLRWSSYLSTTGVYGDTQGGWVDEDSPLSPATERGHKRLQAETDWAAMQQTRDIGLHIFRLSGIYGPGRNQLVALMQGKAQAVVKPGQIFSRIHVDDIATVLLASMQQRAPCRIYNVCDDEPAPPQDVVAYAAKLLGLPAPQEVPFNQADLSPMARSFYAESKRVSNHRIKTELGINLRYPNYRVGLLELLNTV